MAVTRSLDRPAPRQSNFTVWLRENRFALYLIAPTIIILFVLTIFPLVYAVYISVFDYYLPRPHQRTFIGLGNFGEVLTEPRFWQSMKQTAYFMVGSIGVQFVLGLGLAMFFFEEFRGKSAKAIYLPLILLPMMAAPVVVGYMWRLLYQVEFGPLNYLLRGVFGVSSEWTANTSTALLSIIIADIWQWTPFVTLVLLAGLVSLPQELFEVADLDGAKTWQKLRYIIFPLMRRVIAIVLLIRILDSFRELDKIFIMTQGGPGSVTETVSYYAYITGFKYFRVGYAAAMSLLLLAVTVVICVAIAQVLHKEQPAD